MTSGKRLLNGNFFAEKLPIGNFCFEGSKHDGGCNGIKWGNGEFSSDWSQIPHRIFPILCHFMPSSDLKSGIYRIENRFNRETVPCNIMCYVIHLCRTVGHTVAHRDLHFS